MYTEYTTMKTWGSGICLGINATIRNMMGLKVGTPVEITLNDGELIIKKAEKQKSIFPYTEDELIAGSASNEFYSDLVAQPLESEMVE